MRYIVSIAVDIEPSQWASEYSDDLEAPPSDRPATPATVIEVADVLRRAGREFGNHWVRGIVDVFDVAVHVDLGRPATRRLIESHEV